MCIWYDYVSTVWQDYVLSGGTSSEVFKKKLVQVG